MGTCLLLLLFCWAWLKTDHTLTKTKIQGYSEYRTVRPNRRGGGVNIYIKEGYTVLNNNEYSNRECGIVHMKVKELNTHIASICTIPHSLFEYSLLFRTVPM